MVHHPFVNRVTHSRTRDVAKTNGKIGGAPAMKQICTYHQNRETGVPCKEAHVPGVVMWFGILVVACIIRRLAAQAA